MSCFLGSNTCVVDDSLCRIVSNRKVRNGLNISLLLFFGEHSSAEKARSDNTLHSTIC